MPKIYIMNETGQARFYDFDRDTIYVGRSGDNDIQIKDRFVSRLHLKINQVGKRFFIKDLKSTNGTYINGKPIISGIGFEVEKGAPIVIGTSVICVGEMPKNDAQSILKAMKPFRELVNEIYDLDPDRPMTYQKNLDLMNRVKNILTQKTPIDDRLGKVLDDILDFFNRVDKSAIILIDKENGQISKTIIRCQDELDLEEPWYSQNVVDMVVGERNAVVIPDTDVEDEYNLSDTLKVLKIGSVLCIPLISGAQMEGVFYIDSIDGVNGFRKDDFALFSSMGAAIAMTVESSYLQ
ncbi:MAG: FHA domain-containing protein [Deltaproteobacteria bacterium]|nr:FHA domain-containing protein [Deltaproteobacteria bacterium]